jgi:CheY-like chemotaxis protein
MSETKKRVLVIDDDEIVRSVLRKMIERTGAEVVTAANGGETETALKGGKFDLIFLDLIMPDETGWALLDKLEAHSVVDGEDTAIVAITGAELSGEEKTKLSKRTRAVVQKGTFSLDKMKGLLDELLA